MALLNRGMKLDAISAAQLDPKRCKSCEIRLCDGTMYPYIHTYHTYIHVRSTNTKSILNIIPVADKDDFKVSHPSFFFLFFFFFMKSVWFYIKVLIYILINYKGKTI